MSRQYEDISARPIAWFFRYGLSEADTAPTVKNTRINAGSARLPTQLVRLDPRPPSGLAVSSPASVSQSPPGEHERATDQIREKRQRQRLVGDYGTIADTVR